MLLIKFKNLFLFVILSIVIFAGCEFSNNPDEIPMSDKTMPENTPKPPKISQIPDQTMDMNSKLIIPFRIEDPDTPPDSLILYVGSMNMDIIHIDGVHIKGSSNDLELSILPRFGQSGMVKMLVSVNDTFFEDSTTFTITIERDPVNDAYPTIECTPGSVDSEDIFIPTEQIISKEVLMEWLPGQSYRYQCNRPLTLIVKPENLLNTLITQVPFHVERAGCVEYHTAWEIPLTLQQYGSTDFLLYIDILTGEVLRFYQQFLC
jgi:hypothetical protein